MQEYKVETLTEVLDHYLDNDDDLYELRHDLLACLQPNCEDLREWIQQELSESFGG